MVARGAFHDKGQCVTGWPRSAPGTRWPAARPAASPCWWGEEEIGSRNLDAFLAANGAELAADFALISDTGAWDIAALTMRLRGMIGAASSTAPAAMRGCWRG